MGRREHHRKQNCPEGSVIKKNKDRANAIERSFCTDDPDLYKFLRASDGKTQFQ